MSTDYTKQSDPSFKISIEDERVMTTIPKPIQKPFRRLEIAAGLVCIVAGIWMLAQFGLWLTGSVPFLEIRSMGEAVLLLIQSVYLIGFSINLLRSGYVALVFWMITIAILVTLLLTAVVFN
jgi:hypothetical protein